MSKVIRTTLLLVPNKYSLKNSFKEILLCLSENVIHFDIRTEIPSNLFFIASQMFRFTESIRKRWEQYFLNRINKLLLDKIVEINPEIIFVYNSEYLLPSTCQIIKSKSIKLIFFMGDSPYYTPTNKYYLKVLTYADIILSPDSFWNHQVRLLGINSAHYFSTGLNSSYFPISSEKLLDNKETYFVDSLYVGLNYTGSWGLKKAMFMNSFVPNDIRIFGNKHWQRWFMLFPDLENRFTLSSYIPTEILNIMYNKAKIIPVDGNPGLINGFHLRLLEALGSGTLPIAEYRDDINNIFLKESNVKLPLVKDYNRASEIASYYINNNKEREELVEELRNFINYEYNHQRNANRLLEYLRIKV